MDTNEELRILGLLKERFSGPHCLFFSHLRTATGHDIVRVIDAYAYHIYRTHRRNKIAFEIKTSRADYASEVANPDKRHEAMKFSNQYYFVAPKDLIKPEELPEGCGLMEVTAGSVRTKKIAPWRECEELPCSFVASLLQQENKAEQIERQMKLWRFAGKEMTKQEMEETIRSSLGNYEKQEIEKGVRAGVEQWKKKDRLVQLLEVLREETGLTWEYGDPPTKEEFRNWLHSQRAGVPMQVLESDLAYDIQRLQTRLAMLLKDFKAWEKRKNRQTSFEKFRIKNNAGRLERKRRNAQRKEQRASDPVQGSPHPPDSGKDQDPNPPDNPASTASLD